MVKQSAGTHQPLGWYDRVRLRAAWKHLRSPFHAVRMAAHKEIQAILRKTRGVRRRMRAWAGNTARAGARRVTPKRLHRVLGVQARAPKPPRRSAATPLAQHRVPRGGFVPPHGYNQTKADLRDRARAAAGKPARQDGRADGPDLSSTIVTWEGAHRRDEGRQPAPAPDIRQQAGLVPPARTDAPQKEKGRWAGLRPRLATPAPVPAPDVLDDRLPAQRVADNARPSRSRTV